MRPSLEEDCELPAPIQKKSTKKESASRGPLAPHPPDKKARWDVEERGPLVLMLRKGVTKAATSRVYDEDFRLLSAESDMWKTKFLNAESERKKLLEEREKKKKHKVRAAGATVHNDDLRLLSAEREMWKKKFLNAESERRKLSEAVKIKENFRKIAESERKKLSEERASSEMALYEETKKSSKVEKQVEQLRMELCDSLTAANKAKKEKDEATKETVKIKENFRKMAEDQFECSICAEVFVTATTLSCGHSFCSYCICKWVQKKPHCPLCRSEIKHNTGAKVLDEFVDQVYLNFASEGEQASRTSLQEERVKMMKEMETWVEQHQQRGEEDQDDGEDEEGDDGEEDSDSEGVETLAESSVVHDEHSHQPNLEDPPHNPYPLYLNHGYANYGGHNYGYWDYHQQQWFPYNPYF